MKQAASFDTLTPQLYLLPVSNSEFDFKHKQKGFP